MERGNKMRRRSYWNCKKEISRKELLRYSWVCSIPFVGWISLLLVMILKPDNKNGKWK